ncbi:MAG: N-acetyltransferase [Desulfobulbaceae bacterium]|nr:MAG: N-acetyltransferase [Desulfobulbaceae bacterium]
MQCFESPPTITEYLDLRSKAGLSPKSREAAEVGLANSLYVVQLRADDKLIAMGRVVGDGGCFFEIVDIAVLPEYQSQGLGKKIMTSIDAYLQSATYEGSYVSMIADQPEFYERLGYKRTSPSEGMYKRY